MNAANHIANEKSIADALKTVLATTYDLYMKTHAYHWNVEGIHFKQLHEMFEEQYNEMWTSLDEIAERIRTLGVKAPRNGAELSAQSKIKPEEGDPSSAEMLANLTADHETLIDVLKTTQTLAQELEDEVTTDLMVQRLAVHEKTLWMLKVSTK